MSANPSPNRRAYVSLIIGLFSIGFSAIFISLADAPGTVSAFYRMGIAAVLVALPFLRQTRRSQEPLPGRGIKLALLGGLLFALDVSFWATGITMSGAATPTLMANTAPLWVGLGSMLIFYERLRPLFWAGLALAMIGALLVMSAAFFSVWLARGTSAKSLSTMGMLPIIALSWRKSSKVELGSSPRLSAKR